MEQDELVCERETHLQAGCCMGESDDDNCSQYSDASNDLGESSCQEEPSSHCRPPLQRANDSARYMQDMMNWFVKQSTPTDDEESSDEDNLATTCENNVATTCVASEQEYVVPSPQRLPVRGTKGSLMYMHDMMNWWAEQEGDFSGSDEDSLLSGTLEEAESVDSHDESLDKSDEIKAGSVSFRDKGVDMKSNFEQEDKRSQRRRKSKTRLKSKASRPTTKVDESRKGTKSQRRKKSTSRSKVEAKKDSERPGIEEKRTVRGNTVCDKETHATSISTYKARTVDFKEMPRTSTRRRRRRRLIQKAVEMAAKEEQEKEYDSETASTSLTDLTWEADINDDSEKHRCKPERNRFSCVAA